MSNTRIQTGKQGEEDCAEFLRTRGYTVKERNWRSPFGEIDIIASRKGVVVFFEVKKRSSDIYGSAAEAVNAAKQRHMVRAALSYIKANGLSGRDFRFDVLAIMPDGIEHIENAFWAEGYTL